ncbi:hypothetical protein HaLaN_15372 [Haematococcus lacustris]|uniref:Uncharacterized protein n=1 Tax=Haematococcus lacustris TaxID=44745 RepID=A0A699ZGJ1_HAELA|nr:hypothetical protein HaLaN_15372 [Haematococcus lacustris]
MKADDSSTKTGTHYCATAGCCCSLTLELPGLANSIAPVDATCSPQCAACSALHCSPCPATCLAVVLACAPAPGPGLRTAAAAAAAVPTWGPGWPPGRCRLSFLLPGVLEVGLDWCEPPLSVTAGIVQAAGMLDVALGQLPPAELVCQQLACCRIPHPRGCADCLGDAGVDAHPNLCVWVEHVFTRLICAPAYASYDSPFPSRHLCSVHGCSRAAVGPAPATADPSPRARRPRDRDLPDGDVHVPPAYIATCDKVLPSKTAAQLAEPLPAGSHRGHHDLRVRGFRSVVEDCAEGCCCSDAAVSLLSSVASLNTACSSPAGRQAVARR